MNKKMYLKEFQFFNGENIVTLNIYYLDEPKNRITVAISYQGRIQVAEFELKRDNNGLYFEFGNIKQNIIIWRRTKE